MSKLLSLMLCLLLTMTTYAQLTGPYLGQAPPGAEFVQFAPGIVPAEMMHSVTVSPDGQEIYWAANDGIYVTKQVDDLWTTPEIVSFSGIGTDFYDEAPVVSPDNQKMFFNSKRPYGSHSGYDWRYWVTERTETGWAEPQPLPDIINDDFGGHFQVSVANSGTLYYSNFYNFESVIYYSEYIDGEYTAPQPLSVINNYGNVFAPFVAPDESYIIFSLYDGGLDYSEGYYISFKDSEGQWLTPELLVILPYVDGSPVSRVTSFVSRDGLYMFSVELWGSADIIENLRPQLSCCVGITGNADGDEHETIDIADLVYMVEYQFNSGPSSTCEEEADIDGVDGVDIGDLVYMVEYQFLSGPPPPECPAG